METFVRSAVIAMILWVWGYFSNPPSGLRVVFSNVRYEGYPKRRIDYSSTYQDPDTTKFLSLKDLEALTIKSAELTKVEAEELILLLKCADNDSITTALCYHPRHAVQFIFPDNSVRLMGFCFECYTGEQYGKFGRSLVLSNRFWRYLGQLKENYSL